MNYILNSALCSCSGVCIQHEVDCCKEELPYILPSEVAPVLQQVVASHEPQEGVVNEVDNNTIDNTTNTATGDTVDTGDTHMTNDTVVATLDAAGPPIANESVAEPMELDHQISSSTPAPPTGIEW